MTATTTYTSSVHIDRYEQPLEEIPCFLFVNGTEITSSKQFRSLDSETILACAIQAGKREFSLRDDYEKFKKLTPELREILARADERIMTIRKAIRDGVDLWANGKNDIFASIQQIEKIAAIYDRLK